MTNADRIRSMNDEDLGDYIYSVFLTGKYYGQLDKSSDEFPNFNTWLASEELDIDIAKFLP